MNIVEIAKELNHTYKTEREKNLKKQIRETYKTESEKNLEAKIQKLDNIVAELTKRVEYLEKIFAKNAEI